MSTARHTIGILVDYIDHLSRGYEFELRTAFDAVCRERDVNLVIVAGRALGEPDPRSLAHSGIYQLVNPSWASGLVLVSAGLGSYQGVAGVERFADALRPLPLVSLGVELRGVPSVVADNCAGMEAAVEHVVGYHGARRIAFLGGPAANPDARARLESYQGVLVRHGRTVDPDLVTTSEFTFDAGLRVGNELVEGGKKFDALVAANDGLGLGAASALRAHGLRVPSDVLVTGFDNLLMSRLGDPPLSTVQQPLAAMARRSVELLLDQIAGRAVPRRTALMAEFLPRESCGCGYRRRTDSVSPEHEGSARSMERDDFVQIFKRLIPETAESDQRRRARASALLDAMEQELHGARGAFIARLSQLLDEHEDDNEVYEEFQSIVSALRRELRGATGHDLEGLWDRARRRISLVNTRSQVRQRTHLEVTYDRLITTGERLSTALDMSTLKSALTEELPKARVSNVVVSHFTGEERGVLEPFLCLRDGETYDPAQGSQLEFSLVPTETLATPKRRTWIALPLTSEDQILGIMVFEAEYHVSAYEMLRGQISSALKTVSMHREIVRQTAIHERSVQERAATAERMNALSVLAGGVAHDLNNALGPLVALPDIILQELQELAQAPLTEASELYTDLKTIKSAGLRAAQTIKDLLALARVGRVNKEQLDLNQVIASCLAAHPYRTRAGQHRDVRLIYEQNPEPLFVVASESHLVRAVLNLLHNALESIDGAGAVTIRTAYRELTEPLSAYEAIEPGRYAVITVSDTGQGIQPDVMRRVFEPFFSSKKAHENSGSGLGLAIVHSVVKEHGGFVDIESEVLRGTSFSLYLPAVDRPAQVERQRPPSVKPGSARILVVDDDPVQLRTARRILTRLGYDITTTDSGTRAHALFQDRSRGATEDKLGSAPFDLVVMDMILREPEDGLSVLERILRLFPEQRAILVSGHAPMERGALALERGIGWLAKPYTLEGLGRAVQAALASMPWSSDASVAENAASGTQSSPRPAQPRRLSRVK